MLKRITLFTAFLFLVFNAHVFADPQDNRLEELVAQLQGKACKYELQGSSLAHRSLFASFMRRSDKEQCIIDAAKALGMMGVQAQGAVPALLEALANYHNVDSGDGIIPVRSEIVLALGKIGDPSAIKPLIVILASDDPVKLSESSSVPAGYKLVKGTSYGAVVEALGMFGPQAKEALPELNNLLAKERGDVRDYERGRIEEAIRKINQ